MTVKQIIERAIHEAEAITRSRCDVLMEKYEDDGSLNALLWIGLSIDGRAEWSVAKLKKPSIREFLMPGSDPDKIEVRIQAVKVIVTAMNNRRETYNPDEESWAETAISMIANHIVERFFAANREYHEYLWEIARD